MRDVPKQLLYAKKLGDALYEEHSLSATVEGMEVEISRPDKEMVQVHKAIYEVFADGLNTLPGTVWISALFSIQDPQYLSFFCDDSLNVRGLEIVDITDQSTMLYFGEISSLEDLNEAVLFAVEEVLKDNEYL